MPTTYSATPSSISPYTLTDEEHAAVGRLIRACAEIEDIINLRLADLTGVLEGTVLLFLGRTALAKRLNILKLVSDGKGAEAQRLFAEAFDCPEFRDIQEMRNTLAHGRLLGLTDEGNIAFAIVEPQGIDSKKIHMTVHAFVPGAFAVVAHMAEDIIPKMEAAFGLTALREKRRAPTLSPHNKTLPKEQRGSELSRQRRASEESNRQVKKARKDAQRRDPKNRPRER